MKRLFWIIPLMIVSVLTLTWCNNSAELAWQLAWCEVSLETFVEQAEEYNEMYIACEIEKQKLIKEAIIEKDNRLTGDVTALTGVSIVEIWVVLTGETEDISLSEIPATPNMIIEPLFPPQPTKSAGNYWDATIQLNEYAHSNMVEIPIPKDPSNMVIILKKDVTDNGRNLVVYVNPVWVSWYCGWRILHNIEWHEFSFDLHDINLQWTACDWDRATKFGDATTIKVWWYISEYNWNQIQNIYFE